MIERVPRGSACARNRNLHPAWRQVCTWLTCQANRSFMDRSIGWLAPFVGPHWLSFKCHRFLLLVVFDESKVRRESPASLSTTKSLGCDFAFKRRVVSLYLVLGGLHHVLLHFRAFHCIRIADRLPSPAALLLSSHKSTPKPTPTTFLWLSYCRPAAVQPHISPQTATVSLPMIVLSLPISCLA